MSIDHSDNAALSVVYLASQQAEDSLLKIHNGVIFTLIAVHFLQLRKDCGDMLRYTVEPLALIWTPEMKTRQTVPNTMFMYFNVKSGHLTTLYLLSQEFMVYRGSTVCALAMLVGDRDMKWLACVWYSDLPSHCAILL